MLPKVIINNNQIIIYVMINLTCISSKSLSFISKSEIIFQHNGGIFLQHNRTISNAAELIQI